MRLVADESVDRPVVHLLRDLGHTVTYIAETSRSAPDEFVLETAGTLTCPLLTADKDFAEMVFRQGRATAGVILLRLAGLGAPEKASITAEAIAEHGGEMTGVFTVISPTSVRIRRLP